MSSSKSPGEMPGPREITRAVAELLLAVLLRVAARDVGGPGHVDGDRDRGLERERSRPRAEEVAGLLAHGRDRDDVAGRAARLGHAPRGLEHDVGPETVVERARGEAAVAQLDGAPAARTAGSPTRTALHASSASRAPMSMCRSSISTRALSSPLLPGRPLRGDDAGHAAVAGQDLHALAEQHLRVPAAEAAEREHAASSACVTATPISSMWPKRASSGPPPVPAHAGHRVADGVAGAPRRTRRPPRARARPRRPRSRSGRALRAACGGGPGSATAGADY